MWLFALYLLALSAGALQAAGVVVAAVVGGVVTYLVARRTSSGSASKSDAGTLWEAAEQIRTELREEVVARREENVALKAQVVELTGRLTAAEGEIARLRAALGEGGP